MSSKGWIGVDFDGTLSEYRGWQGKGIYGPPIPAMVQRIHRWLAEGKIVKIMTARADDEREIGSIKRWLVWECQLPWEMDVTNVKDMNMIELWDDRAVTVEKNTGVVITKGREND